MASRDQAVVGAACDVRGWWVGAGNAVGIPRFDEGMAHLLMAAADYVVVPSRFEPCGLVAQAAVRYGAVPIVTAVGGLADFVTPAVPPPAPPTSHMLTLMMLAAAVGSRQRCLLAWAQQGKEHMRMPGNIKNEVVGLTARGCADRVPNAAPGPRRHGACPEEGGGVLRRRCAGSGGGL